MGSYRLGTELTSFTAHPLYPIKVQFVGDDQAKYLPAIYVAQTGSNENFDQMITATGNLTNLLGLTSSLRILLTKNSGKLLRFVAVVEVANITVGEALKQPALRASIAALPGGASLLEKWPIISIALDITTISADILSNLASNGPAFSKAFKDQGYIDEASELDKVIKEATNALNDKGNVVDDLISNGLNVLEESVAKSLKAKGLSNAVIDDIILRAMYIDDVLGANKMLSLIDNLSKSPKFKNPEDLLENLNSVYSGNKVNTFSAKNLLHEFEEGKYWINQGNDVYISKKWSVEADEVDITIVTKGALVECKNISGGEIAIRENIDLIIQKYTKESKLKTSIKTQYPNHLGKLNINNSSNPYYNLNKQAFINKIRLDLFPNIESSGINKNLLVGTVKELHVENGTGRFVIYNTDW